MNPTLFLSIFTLYILAMIGLSLWISARTRSGEDFLLGNRSVPLFLVLGTTVATMVGTGSSMGAVGKAYLHGWEGALYGIGGALGILTLAKCFAKVRTYRFMTFSEEMSFYYGANPMIKNCTALLIFIACIGWLGAHIMGGGKYLAWITGISPLYAKTGIALAFGVYVIIGGYMSVVWTDTIQALILFFGFILMAAFSLAESGGISNLNQAMGEHSFDFLTSDRWLPSLSMAFVIFVGVMATPSYRQRIYSSDSVNTVKKSFYTSGALYLFFSLIPAIIGISARVIHPNLSDVDFAFPALAVAVLPLGLAITVLIAGLSATMSSASSDAIAGVSILMRDVYQMIFKSMPSSDKAVRLSRWGLSLITLLALMFTLMADNVISYINGMISLVMSGMFVASLLGRYWSRATWQGGLAALLGGALMSLYVMNHEASLAFWGNPSIPSVLFSTLCCIIVSYSTPRNTVSPEVALELLSQERSALESGSTHD